MESKNPQKKRRWRFRLMLAFLAGIVIWVNLPLSPAGPRESLLSLLPPELFPLGFELRGAGGEWRDLESSGAGVEIAGWPALRETGYPDLRQRIEAVFIRPLLLRVLDGQVACGLDPLRSGEGGGIRACLILRLDNLSYLLVRGYHLFFGLPSDALLKNGSSAVVWQGRMVMVATSSALLEEMRLRSLANTQGVEYKRTEPADYPARGAVLSVRSSAALRKLWPECPVDMPGEWMASREGRTFLLRFYGALRSERIEEAQRRSEERWGSFKPPPALRAVEGVTDSWSSSPLFVLRGALNPGLFWTALGSVLFPPDGSPGVAEYPPLLVMGWEIADQSLIPSLDGRIQVVLEEARAKSGGLPVPFVRAELMSSDVRLLHKHLDEGVDRWVTLFRAPGGSELWEAVRRETELTLPPPGPGRPRLTRMRLHPLFFHSLEPAWESREEEGLLTLVSHVEGISSGLRPGSLRWAEPNRSVMAALTADLRVDPDEVAHWRRLFVDKIDRHGWIPEDSRPLWLSTFASAERFLLGFSHISATLFLRQAEGGVGKETADLFWLDTTVRFRLKDVPQK